MSWTIIDVNRNNLGLMKVGSTSTNENIAMCKAQESSSKIKYELPSSLIAGILAQREQLEQPLSECNLMASRSCSSNGDKETNTLCLGHLLEVARLAYIVTQSGSISGDNLLNCDGVCNL